MKEYDLLKTRFSKIGTAHFETHFSKALDIYGLKYNLIRESPSDPIKQVPCASVVIYKLGNKIMYKP